MRIFADKLQDQLNRQLLSCYMIFGNEPLLIQESRDFILARAKQLGFDEKHNFTLDSHINWNDVYDCCNALSLFSSRQVIEIEVPESGINAAASKELIQLEQSIHSDILLLLVGSKLTKAQENAKWFKTLNQKGSWVSCITPDIQRLPQFIQTRCRNLNLRPDAQALQMLAQWHEGNLLALVQSLEKLALLYPDGELNMVRVEESLSRHNHFTPFHWMDALLAGQPKRAQRILRQLELEGIEPVILLRTLQRELTLIAKLKSELQTLALGALFEKHRIWQSKQPFYSATLQRLDIPTVRRLLKDLAAAEILSKTQYETPVWPALAQLSLQFCSDSSVSFSNIQHRA